MTQDNPFAKLGALDQKLYQETTPKQHVEEVEKRVEEDLKEKENASFLVNQQTSKLVKKKTSKSVNQETSKEINQQTNKLASSQYNLQPLSTKEKKKYGTYLREDSISKIQVHAIQTKRKDHEVLQEAVDFYFEYKKK
jgi:ribonuclease PH